MVTWESIQLVPSSNWPEFRLSAKMQWQVSTMASGHCYFTNLVCRCLQLYGLGCEVYPDGFSGRVWQSALPLSGHWPACSVGALLLTCFPFCVNESLSAPCLVPICIILLPWDCLCLQISKWGFRFFLTWFVKCLFSCICGACGTSRNKSTHWGLDHTKWSQQILKITCRILAVDGNDPSTIHCFSGSSLHLHIICT